MEWAIAAVLKCYMVVVFGGLCKFSGPFRALQVSNGACVDQQTNFTRALSAGMIHNVSCGVVGGQLATKEAFATCG